MWVRNKEQWADRGSDPPAPSCLCDRTPCQDPKSSGVARAGLDGRGPYRNKWSAKSRHGVGRAEGDGAQHEAPVLERHTTRFRAGRQPGPLTAPVLGRSGCLSRPQSKEAAVSTRGRLLHATTDWRSLCRPISFDSGSAAAVGRQERWTQRLFVWLAKGGRTVEDFESNGCARRARKLCGAAYWGGDLRAGEKVRERAGVAGARAR